MDSFGLQPIRGILKQAFGIGGGIDDALQLLAYH
jgi:hypothetical protein